MKNRIFWTALVVQAALFYGLPLLAGPADAMGMVLLLLLGTLGLSAAVGGSAGWKRCLYPVTAAILFIPSVWLYYNESALIHALWYLVVAAVGVAIGTLMRGIGKSMQGRKQ